MNEKKISLTSRKKWFYMGITIALLNPIFSGIILGVAFWTEPELKKESRIILGLSIVWGIIFNYLSRWLMSQGYLPSY